MFDWIQERTPTEIFAMSGLYMLVIGILTDFAYGLYVAKRLNGNTEKQVHRGNAFFAGCVVTYYLLLLSQPGLNLDSAIKIGGISLVFIIFLGLIYKISADVLISTDDSYIISRSNDRLANIATWGGSAIYLCFSFFGNCYHGDFGSTIRMGILLPSFAIFAYGLMNVEIAFKKKHWRWFLFK